MTSYQITLSPHRRAATRFIDDVKRGLQFEIAKSGITQSDIARVIGVHRSVINRELNGLQNIGLGRAAEIAWAIGKVAKFDLVDPNGGAATESNIGIRTRMR